MTEHHARLAPDATYVLMVAVANETACRFYERNDLVVERRIPDGKAFDVESMKGSLPAERRVSGVRPATVGAERPT